MLSFSFAFSVFFSLWLLIEDLEYWWPPGWVLFNYQVWLLCPLIISNFVEKTIIVTHLKFEQTVLWYTVLVLVWFKKKKKQTAKTFRYPPLFLGHAVMFSMSVKYTYILSSAFILTFVQRLSLIPLFYPLSEYPRMTKEWPWEPVCPIGFSFFSIFKYPIIYSVCPTFCVSDSDLNSPRNNKESGAEMRPKIVSDIVTGEAPISYWPICFPVPDNSPRSLCESKLGQVCSLLFFFSGES